MRVFILLFFVFSFSAHADQPKSKNTRTGVGRFQLIQLSDFRRDQFMIDTDTGRVWNRACLKMEGGECDTYGWIIEAAEDINAKKKIQPSSD